MKSKVHAVAGVLGFLLITTFVTSTVGSELFGSDETIAAVKTWLFRGVFVLLVALIAAGASGVSLLGKRTDSLALVKQKRGPIGFMTSLLVLLPCSYLLSKWASVGSFDEWFYVVQAAELAASSVVIAMIGLNIRDGLKLTGRTGAGAPKTPMIEERDGGPLVVHRLPVLNGADGEPLERKPTIALCRCGASKKKPFCDGSHNKIAFDSRPTDDRTKDEIRTYEGKEITIHYNRLLCSHAAECGSRQKAAFDSSRTPWIVPDNASREEIIEVVKTCPFRGTPLQPGRQ